MLFRSLKSRVGCLANDARVDVVLDFLHQTMPPVALGKKLGCALLSKMAETVMKFFYNFLPFVEGRHQPFTMFGVCLLVQ